MHQELSDQYKDSPVDLRPLEVVGDVVNAVRTLGLLVSCKAIVNSSVDTGVGVLCSRNRCYGRVSICLCGTPAFCCGNRSNFPSNLLAGVRQHLCLLNRRSRTVCYRYNENTSKLRCIHVCCSSSTPFVLQQECVYFLIRF